MKKVTYVFEHTELVDINFKTLQIFKEQCFVKH